MSKYSKQPADTIDVQQYLEAWNRHDIDAIVNLHSQDTVFISAAFGREATGIAELRETLVRVFAAWPDLQLVTRQLHVTPTLIVFEGDLEGTLAVPLPVEQETIQPNGRRLSFSVVDIFSVDALQGLILRKQTYIDSLSFYRQATAK